MKWRGEANEQLLIALRDGDLHAQGRLSTERNRFGWEVGKQWILHSGHQQPISPAHWREGEYSFSKLTFLEGEFIDIRVPRFMVLAIWPAFVPPAMAISVDVPPYTTPYLALMEKAITQFGMSEGSQEKKESLYEWFRAQEVDGELVSQNLADAMATLIRLPSSQRGGSRRVSGPDLRQAG